MEQLEFDFILPRGYKDLDGTVHRAGKMRLAEAIDEIIALDDPRVQKSEAYLPVILFSRVITSLGTLDIITPDIVEKLYVSDFAYLEDVYMRINGVENLVVAAVCPHCQNQFQLQVSPLSNAIQTE